MGVARLEQVVASRVLEPNPPATVGAPESVDRFLERHAGPFEWYGSGKAALRDGLAPFVSQGDAVVLPSYVPDGLVEPFTELGLEVRFHAISPSLMPDSRDLEVAMDDDVAAVVSVDYFGFPAPAFDETAALAADHGSVHVADSAHGLFSVADERSLGARGDLGIASLPKVLPVPNGGALFLPNPRIQSKFRPTELTGTHRRYTAADLQFGLKRAVTDSRVQLLDELARRLTAHVANGDPGPRARYEAGKMRRSRLSAAICARTDPRAVRAQRRMNYRGWHELFADRSDVHLLFEDLPPGTCPLACPVRTTRPDDLIRELERAGIRGAHCWPRLPAAVRDDPSFECARTLATQLVAVPVHQGLQPETIEAVGTLASR